MRIVIDMQGMQTGSRFRGIGRYTLSLAQAIARNRGEHEIILALSGLFPDTIELIRAAFDGLLPQENIHVWYAPGPVRECEPGNEWRREVAERIREAFFASLHVDMVIVTSLFEGLGDDAVTSVGIFDRNTPVATILYDLIPLISPDIHFKSSKLHQDFYSRKIASLRRSRKLLAISDSTRREAVEVLGFDERDVVNISGASDTTFQIFNISETEKREIYLEAGITRPFVMYAGGADERKNLHRLIQAYAKLPPDINNAYQLVIVGKMPEDEVIKLKKTAKSGGINGGQLLFTGYVADEELAKLYNLCAVFVLPSLHEGFGLPALEAMSCGAPVIGANATSLPEVIGWADALFDPHNIESISKKITDVLTDESFRKDLILHGTEQAKKFSWNESARRTLKFLELFNSVKLPSGDRGVMVVKTRLFQKIRKKILIIKLDHLGDFIMAIPAITKLRAKYPYAQIDIVLGSWNEPIAKSLNIFTNIYKFDFFKKKSALMPTCTDEEIESVLGQLDSYDIAIDLRRQGDTRFLLVQTTARLKVGYASNNTQFDHALDIVIPAETDEPFKITRLNRTSISIQMLKIIEALPMENEDFILFPELQERKFLNKLEIAVFPKAGNPVKEWGKENFKDLVALICADDRIDAVNVYFANCEESQEVELKAHKKMFIHTGLGFKELVHSLSRNVVCVTNSSFGAHLGAYLELCVIAVYTGQETTDEWAPVFGDSYVVHRSVSCSPCHIAKKDDCKHGFMCLSGISPNYVFDLIMEIVVDFKKDMTLIPDRMRSVSMAPVCDRVNVVDDLLESIAVLKVSNISDKDLRGIAECIEQSIPQQDTAK